MNIFKMEEAFLIIKSFLSIFNFQLHSSKAVMSSGKDNVKNNPWYNSNVLKLPLEIMKDVWLRFRPVGWLFLHAIVQSIAYPVNTERSIIHLKNVCTNLSEGSVSRVDMREPNEGRYGIKSPRKETDSNILKNVMISSHRSLSLMQSFQPHIKFIRKHVFEN